MLHLMKSDSAYVSVSCVPVNVCYIYSCDFFFCLACMRTVRNSLIFLTVSRLNPAERLGNKKNGIVDIKKHK